MALYGFLKYIELIRLMQRDISLQCLLFYRFQRHKCFCRYIWMDVQITCLRRKQAWPLSSSLLFLYQYKLELCIISKSWVQNGLFHISTEWTPKHTTISLSLVKKMSKQTLKSQHIKLNNILSVSFAWTRLYTK